MPALESSDSFISQHHPNVKMYTMPALYTHTYTTIQITDNRQFLQVRNFKILFSIDCCSTNKYMLRLWWKWIECVIILFSEWVRLKKKKSSYWKNCASEIVLVVKNKPASAGGIRDIGSIPGWGRLPGGGQGNPLQYSCLENPMDRGAWRATVQGVTKSQTQLKRLSMYTCTENRAYIQYFLCVSQN